MKRVPLVAATTGYQVREFGRAAEHLGIELVLATDRCHILSDPWADQATAVRFEDPAAGIEALGERGPFDGIVAVGDRPAYVAARIAERYGLRFHPAGAAADAGNKLRTRERFQAAGMRVPAFRLVPHASNCKQPLLDGRGSETEPRPSGSGYPMVIKPLDAAGSRGVIRVNDEAELRAARARIGRMLRNPDLLIEDFIPGREFALEGLVTRGRLHVLALFDKPDPLDGPFFEETIYVTPSREPELVQQAIREAAQQAVTALGLTDGPVHAEMRVNDAGVWMLEAAARPIGGLCSRVLRINGRGLEEALLRHALGEDASAFRLDPGAHSVMMIPIPTAGVFRGVEGLESARQTPGIEDVVITAKEGQILVPLPEGASYLGFIFARAATPQEADRALRSAHSKLVFDVPAALPVVR